MSEGFAALGVSEEVEQSLAARGIVEPFRIQSLVVPDALAGRDVLGKAPTGSGKTLAFGLPIVELVEPKGDAPVALNIVRSHHERMDGRGVPDGLVGAAIPLEARIAAVADAIDAMTSGRPYRGNELSLEAALKELQRNAGTQFDDEIVEAVLAATLQGDLYLLPRTTGQFPAVTGGTRIGAAETAIQALARD